MTRWPGCARPPGRWPPSDIPADRLDGVLDALVLAFSGALLQAGMGLITYTDLGDRLDSVVAAIVEGHL